MNDWVNEYYVEKKFEALIKQKETQRNWLRLF